MKVVVLFDNFGPYHIARLKALSARCDLLAIELNAKSSEYSWLVAPNVPFERVTLGAGGADWATRRIEMLKVLGRFNPDVILVPGWIGKAQLAALLWAERERVPAILMSDSQEIDFKRQRWKEKIKSSIIGGFSGSLVAGTPHAYYVRQLGMQPELVRTGYDVVDNLYFSNGADAARVNSDIMRKKYRLPRKYFLTTARLIEKKNLSTLLDAYSEYRRLAVCEQMWDLVILGDGELRLEIVERIKRLELSDHVHLRGFRQYEELPAFYGLADAFILPSSIEQWGLVINEAMASGLPVLVSDRCGCAIDLIEEGKNGYIFAHKDKARLASLMRHLAKLEDDELRIMGSASRRILEPWSLETFCDNVLELAILVSEQPRRQLFWPTKLLMEIVAR